jgi:phosphonate transport system permease protein
VRALLGLLRAVHELVWAWLFVAAVGLSPAAAVLALALPYAGILGRILADMLRDVPAEPLVALRAAGANEAKVLLYGRLPAALPDMVSYALYRYECGLRSAAVLSFVGLGGLGFQIQLSLDDLRFAEVWTFVYALVLLVVVVELASAAVRSRLRS